MDLDLNLGQWIVIALSAFLFLWYFFANTANRRQGIATYRWLRQALEVYGKISRAEWIGASNMGARLTVDKAASPLRRVQAHYLLEPREFLPYWLASRLRGKRDTVVIQADLRTPPKGNLEIRRIAARSANALPGDERVGPDFQIVRADTKSTSMMASLDAYLASTGSTVERILIRRHAPHLELHARLKPLLGSSADSYLGPLLALCQDL
jgi:hypothetical protein